MVSNLDPHVRSPLSIDNFMKIETAPNGKQILDPYSFNFTDIGYYLRNAVGVTRFITRSTAGAPDLISWKEYKSHDYWWMLMIINRIIHGETEVEPGIILFLPRLQDLSGFIQEQKRKKIGQRFVQLGVTPGAQATTSKQR